MNKQTEKSARGLWLVFGGLCLLLTAALFVTQLPAGPWRPAAAMGIAGAKALVIALGFMHLSRSGPVVILYATAGVFWLGILFLLTFADYLTRT